MKKLMTILVVFALCGVAMAGHGGGQPGNGQPGGSQSGGNGQAHIYNGTTVYAHAYSTTAADGSTPLSMTVFGSNNERGHAYFTTMSTEALNAYNQTNGTNKTLTVQFLGTAIDKEHGSNSEKINFASISDYGIYLYDKEAKTIGQTFSINDGKSFNIGTGKDFGVYYVVEDMNGNTKTWYSTENWVGAFDNNTDHYVLDNVDGVEVKKYDEDLRFTCTSFYQTTGAGAWHWEFMLQTTLDDPYYNVDPNHFEGNGAITNIPNTPAPNGQPLPGTLATLLIGGLCAGSLRKKNKKH